MNKELWYRNGLILSIVLLVLCGILAFFYYHQSKSKQAEYDQLRVQSQNEIARLSTTIQENEQTWSRLAQEKDDQIAQLRLQMPELERIISERGEQIQNLTTAVVQLRSVNIRLRHQLDNIHQTEEQQPDGTIRYRVEFDQTEDIIRVAGHTLTSPPEADINVSFTRPVNMTIVTTQRPDLSWRTYVTTDSTLLTVGQIESSVSPLARPQQRHRLEEDFFIGAGLSVGLDGRAGTGNLGVGWDFGAIEAELDGSLIAYPQGVSFGLGAQVRVNPFGL